MNISKVGLDLITSIEQLRLTAYRDAVGVWTIGYGHTRWAVEGMQISAAKALEFLASDVAEAEAAVNRLVKVPLEQHQFDALVSFVFNVGVGAFKSSTLLRLINGRAESMATAAEFLRWVYAKGKKLAGLETRRRKERLLYLGRP